MTNLTLTFSEEIHFNKNLSVKLKNKKSLINSIFEFYLATYYRKLPDEKSFFNQKIHAILTTIIWSFQMASLLWIPSLSISDWNKNRTFWHILGFFRLDNVCSALGVINFCIYVSFTTIMINTLLLIIPIVLIYKSLKFPVLWHIIYKKSFYFLSNYLIIPSIALLSLCLKYNFSRQDKISNYSESNMEDFKVYFAIQILITLSLFLSFLLILMDVLFSGEIRHSMARYKLKAKAYSESEFHEAIFKLSLPVIYAVFSESYIEYFQLIFMISSAILFIETLKDAPYFNFFMNSLNSIKYCAITCLACQFLFGKLLDSSSLIVLFAFTVMPIFCLFSVKILAYRIKKIDSKIPSNPKIIENIYYLERCLRHYFCSHNTEFTEKILTLLGKCYNESKLFKNKLLTIWEVNYCIFTLNNDALAKIKLSKIRNSDFSWEGSYQEYICRKIISEINLNDSAEYLSFFQKFHDFKLEDEILCIKLLDFWKEIVSVKPNIDSLEKLITSISESLVYLEKEYLQLSLSFPKCKEPLILYSSFARNILWDLDKATLFEYKIRSIDKILTNPTKDLKDFSYFDENNGLILASAEKENFGNIIFANPKSLEILKHTIDGLIGSNISSLIPPPYSQYFNKHICSLLQLVDDADLDIPDNFFIELSDGYTTECTGKLSIACFSDKLWFILLFRPKISNTQHALLTESWEISSHSEKFSKLLGTNQRDLRHFNIAQIFPNLSYMSLQPSKLYQVPSFKNDTYLAYCILEIYHIKIPYILLINDPLEIEAWKEENSYEISPFKIDKLEKRNTSPHQTQCSISDQKYLKNNPFLRQNSTIKDTTFKTDAQRAENTYEDIINEKNIENDKNSVKSDTLSQSPILNRIVNLSSRTIKIFHIVLVLSMAAVMITNLIVVFYISAKVTHESNIDAYITLGKLQEVFHAVTHYARGISVIESLNGPKNIIEFCYENYYQQANLLENLYETIVSTLIKWKSCSVSIFTDEAAKLWITDGDIHVEYDNLIDTISEFIKIGNSFIRKQISHEDNTKELEFFSINGFWESFKYCNNSLYNLIECKMEDIDSLKLQMDALLSIGFGVLLICIIIIIPFCVSAINMENKFWNLIKKNAYNCYPELKDACIERLEKIHGKVYSITYDGKRSLEANFKNYWKYIWRIGLYLLIALLFYFLNSLYLYKKCETLLHLRPRLLRDVINTQVSYKALIVWSSEMTVINVPQSLTILLKDTYPFTNLEAKFNEAFQSVSYSVKQIRDKDYVPLVSDDFMTIFYEKVSAKKYFLDYGIYSAGNVMSFEGPYLVFSNRSDFLDLWLGIMLQLNELDDEYDLLIDLVDKDSQNAIKYQLDLIIVSWACFVLSSLTLYIWCYLPFFNTEKKNLEKMKALTKIIPHKSYR